MAKGEDIEGVWLANPQPAITLVQSEEHQRTIRLRHYP
jgi:hypothetical protein